MLTASMKLAPCLQKPSTEAHHPTPSTNSAHQPTSPPARSRQPRKTTFPFLNVSEENSVKPGPKQVTNTLIVSCLGPASTKNGHENVNKMKNAFLNLESTFFPYSFLLATLFCWEFQPLKVVARIYKGRLPLQMSTVLAHPPTNLFSLPLWGFSCDRRSF